MTDEEFEWLKQQLEITTIRLEKLQRKYKAEKGKRWVPEIRLENPIWARRGKK